MVKIFTNEQRQWLHQYPLEYHRRVLKLVPDENGQQYAKARAEEFASKWTTLADGKVLTREDIVTRVITWFKNSNQAGRQCPPLLSHGGVLVPNASLLRFLQEERQKAESSTSTTLRNEQQDAVSLEQQARPEREDSKGKKLAEETAAANESKIVNRRNLRRNLEYVLRSYNSKTGASFYVLMALPSNEINGAPLVSRLEYCSMPDFPSFQTFCQTEEADVFQKWKKYAGMLERKRVLMTRYKDLFTLDEEGYPKVPPVSYDLKELGEALTAYLSYTWCKLHEGLENVPDIPWTAIESDPTKYIDVTTMPSLLLPFQVPTNFLPGQILGLQEFLEKNANRPFPERFPFVIQSEAALKNQDSCSDSETEPESPLPFEVTNSLPPSSPPPPSSPFVSHRATTLPHVTPQRSPSIQIPQRNKRLRDDYDDTAELLRTAKIPKQK